MTLTSALASTSGRWWRTALRLALSTLVLSGLTGAVTSALYTYLVDGTGVQVRWVLIGIAGMLAGSILLLLAALGSSWALTPTGELALSERPTENSLGEDRQEREEHAATAVEIGEELQRLRIASH